VGGDVGGHLGDALGLGRIALFVVMLRDIEPDALYARWLTRRGDPCWALEQCMFFALGELPEAIRELKLIATGRLMGFAMGYCVGKRRLANRSAKPP
jgi:hypothetical protein